MRVCQWKCGPGLTQIEKRFCKTFDTLPIRLQIDSPIRRHDPQLLHDTEDEARLVRLLNLDVLCLWEHFVEALLRNDVAQFVVSVHH